MKYPTSLWDESKLALALKDLRAGERIPPSRRRAETRARLVSSIDVELYAFETRLGWMGVARTVRGIRSVQLPRPSRAQALRDLQSAFPEGAVGSTVPAQIESELCEYAQGQRRSFSTPLDLNVRPFQRAVLEAIAKIPFGETRTYGWVATQIGQPKAARAVGQALHTNPIPIILPCHRVIASNGGLGGYGGGIPLKERLLALEGATYPKTLV